METETNPLTQESNIPASNLKMLFIAVFLFLIPFAVILLTHSETNQREKDISAVLRIKKLFPNVNIQAKAAYVWDAENQKAIYAKNEKDQLPLASLTKIMTALIALEESGDNAKIKITSDSVMQEGDNGLANEEKWRLKDLIDFSLITSSNDGIHAVASVIESQEEGSATVKTPNEQKKFSDDENSRENFIKLMNKKAEDISLNQTFYLNETGLDSSDNISGGYGSAEDMVKLFAYIIKDKPEMLEATAYDEIELTSLDDINHKAQNTNEIIRNIPNLIASKTGYTDISGGNLVVAFDFGLMKPIVISVLGSTREGRFEDMKKLLEATMEYLADENSEIKILP